MLPETGPLPVKKRFSRCRFGKMETMRKSNPDAQSRSLPIQVPTLKRRFVHGCRGRRRGNDRIDHDSDRIYRTIVENTGTAFLLMEQDTTIAMVNEEFEKLSGYRRGQVEGRMYWTRLIAEVDVDRMLRYHYLRRTFPDLAPRNYECRVRVKDGRLRICFFTVAMIPGSDKSIASITDVTEHRELEQRIRSVRENERRRIGQDLHDDLGAHLVGVEAMAELLQRRLAKEGHPQAGFSAEISALINQATTKTRALGRGLCPVDLDDRGLSNALENLKKNTERAFGVVCTLDLSGDIGIRRHTVATQLYRIVQEAVNNALVHGKAKAIAIGMSTVNGVLTLSIADDGVGIAREAEPGDGLGMRTMQHRANRIGAEMTITRRQPRGTLVRCTINPEFLS
jgi:PAS domain S-box-containing protein